MNDDLNLSMIEKMIKKEEKKYGKVFGKLIGQGVAKSDILTELLTITIRYEMLVNLRDSAKPREESLQAVMETNDENDINEDNALPDGICDSENCTDEFCVAYWEDREGGSTLG